MTECLFMGELTLKKVVRVVLVVEKSVDCLKLIFIYKLLWICVFHRNLLESR